MGPCSSDSVAHPRVSKEVTPRIVRTHRLRSFVMKRRGGIVLVSDFTAERNGAHQHRRCSRRRGRCASRRASDARRGSPKAHSRLPATPAPRAGTAAGEGRGDPGAESRLRSIGSWTASSNGSSGCRSAGERMEACRPRVEARRPLAHRRDNDRPVRPAVEEGRSLGGQVQQLRRRSRR